MRPVRMRAIIERKSYDTTKATEVCGDNYWDGHNLERWGRNTYLFVTPRGHYFFQHLSQWQGEAEARLAPCTPEQAMAFYEACQVQGTVQLSWAEAFPEAPVEEA